MQSLYKLSDDQRKLQIKSHLSYMHFLGRGFEDTEPGAKTLWLFRDTFSNKNTMDKLFRIFDRYLDHEVLLARQGQLINASIFPVPEQRNTREENTRIKHGGVPEEWQEQSHKLQKKDTDTRWVKKNGRSQFIVRFIQLNKCEYCGLIKFSPTYFSALVCYTVVFSDKLLFSPCVVFLHLSPTLVI